MSVRVAMGGGCVKTRTSMVGPGTTFSCTREYDIPFRRGLLWTDS